MKIFIFNYISDLTHNYHSGGGLVIIAEDQEHAKEVIKENENIKITPEEWETVESFDLVKSDLAPTFWVMPDAGCC